MQLMRQLEAEHKSLWDQLPQPKPEIVDAKDCEPNLLSGWTDRDISLWDVSAVDGKPTKIDILIALCRRKKNWEKISYLLFSEEMVTISGLSLTLSNGNTGDQRVDLSKTHYEIKGISGKTLCTFLFHISRSKFETGVFTKKEMEKILLDAYDKTKTHHLVESATTQPSHEKYFSSETGERAVTIGVTLEQPPSEIPTTEQMPRSGSSTSFK